MTPPGRGKKSAASGGDTSLGPSRPTRSETVSPVVGQVDSTPTGRPICFGREPPLEYETGARLGAPEQGCAELLRRDESSSGHLVLGPELVELNPGPEAGLVVGDPIAVEFLDPLAADVPTADDAGARLLTHLACERLLKGLSGLWPAAGKAPIDAVPGDEDDPGITGEADGQGLARLIERRPEGRIEPCDAVTTTVLGVVVRDAPHAVEDDRLDEQRVGRLCT
jgi:hypothetical protein